LITNGECLYSFGAKYKDWNKDDPNSFLKKLNSWRQIELAADRD
jgi:hypothetical protein